MEREEEMKRQHLSKNTGGKSKEEKERETNNLDEREQEMKRREQEMKMQRVSKKGGMREGVVDKKG